MLRLEADIAPLIEVRVEVIRPVCWIPVLVLAVLNCVKQREFDGE